MTELTKLPDGTDAIRFYGGENMPVTVERGGIVYPRVIGAFTDSITRLGGTEFRDSFLSQPNGVPSRSVTGETYLLAGTHSSSVTVSGGRLVAVTPEAAVATYTQVELGGAGVRIGARFSLSAYTVNNGAACIGFWATPMDSDTGTPVQDSPCHLVISPEHWAFGVWQNNVLTDVRSVTFATPLATDGTVYSVEVFIDREKATAYLLLPDGSRVSVTHALIGSVDGRYAFIEHFRSTEAGSLPSFVDWWADSVSSAPTSLARSLVSTVPSIPVTKVYNPAVADLKTAPTTAAAVDATNLSITITPVTSKVMVTLQGYVKFFLTCNYFWSLLLVSSVVGDTVRVAGGASHNTPTQDPDQLFVANILVPNLNPGQTYTFKWRHVATVGSAAILQADAPNSNPLVMRAESVN